MSKQKQLCQVFHTVARLQKHVFSTFLLVTFCGIWLFFSVKNCVLNIQTKVISPSFLHFRRVPKNGFSLLFLRFSESFCGENQVEKWVENTFFKRGFAPLFRRTPVFTQFLPPLAPTGRSGKIGGNTMFCEFPFFLSY